MEINALVADIGNLQKAIEKMATDEKVELLEKKLEAFQGMKKAEERGAQKNAMFGDHRTYSAFANVIAKGLASAGHIPVEKAGEWLEKANADVNQTDSGHGSVFLPVAIDPVVSKLVEQNGVLRRNARVINGVQGTIGIKTRATRTTVAGMTRPDSVSSTGGSTYANNPLSCTQIGHITTVEEKLIWDSPVDLVNEAISDLAEAAAEFEDSVLISGDGTAAYLSFTGLKTATTGVGGANVGLSNASFTTNGIDPILNLQTKVHTSVIRGGNSKVYMHPYIFALLQTQKASTAGTYFFDLSTNSFKVGGCDIEFVPRMDSTSATASVPVIFGDLRKAVTVGVGRNYQIRVLNERYADNNEIGIRLTYDMGLVLVQSTAVAKVVLT